MELTLKAGDVVGIYCTMHREVSRYAVVQRVTPKRIAVTLNGTYSETVFNADGSPFGRKNSGWSIPKQTADIRAKIAQIQYEEERVRERNKAVSIVAQIGWTTARNLSLDQLRRITAILDEPKAEG